MTPQERDLITHLLTRLKQAGGQPKDPEADGLIRQAMAEQPDMAYYLVQTVLIQDMALANAQNRIAELERQAAAAAPAPAAQPTSFLGGLFGRGQGSAAPPAAAPRPGPWSRPAAPTPQYQQQPPQQPPYQQPQSQQPPYPPQYQQPMAQAMPMMASGGSGFLRSAATTAAGVAGGALLFEGIQSLFGHHAGGILSGATMQPGLSETVVNNYYGSDQGTAPDTPADWNQDGPVPADYTPDTPDPGYAPDPGLDDNSGQDFASDQDFGDGDLGGGNDDSWT